MSGAIGGDAVLERRARRAGAIGGTGLAVALLSPAALIGGMGGAAFASLLMCGAGPAMWAVGEAMALRRMAAGQSR